MPERTLGPVYLVTLYRADAVTHRRGEPNAPPGGLRGNIAEFTQSSRRRLAFVANNTDIEFQAMVTLTYPRVFPSDGRKVARDRKAFLDFLRRAQERPEYLWFLEFQKRGAPHIHVLYDAPWPRTKQSIADWRDRIAKAWYRIVGSGDERHLKAGTSASRIRLPRGGSRYAVKYAGKMYQKIVPEGYRDCGRFWGHSRGVTPQPTSSIEIDDLSVRALLADWPYRPDETFPLYKVLYNAAPIIEQVIDNAVDLRK